LIIITIIIFILTMTSCGQVGRADRIEYSGSLTQGMNLSDLKNASENTRSCQIHNYYLFSNEKEIVVSELDNDDKTTIVNIFSYKYFTPSDENFTSIKPGMNFVDVIEWAGFPYEQNTFGIDSTDFRSASGIIYRIQWGNDLTVVDVVKV
ncbi:MAG: hypothetical protein J5832_03340, partial [Clostridia bacterium]|nr:hypothetical protein [Clostridia bacterium]